MAKGFKGGKKPPQNEQDDRLEWAKLFFHEPPRTIEITQQVDGVEHKQTIAISKIATFITWESAHIYRLGIELDSGKEHYFRTNDKDKFDEWVGILKAGVR